VLAVRSAAIVRSWLATLFDHAELAECRAFRRARLAVPLNRLTTNTARTVGLYPRDDITVTFDRIESATAVTQHERAQRASTRENLPDVGRISALVGEDRRLVVESRDRRIAYGLIGLG
jgi:hypothetical protein